MSYVYFCLICLLFGSNFYLMKLATSAYGPATIGASRLLSAAAVLGVAWWATARRERVPRRLWLTIVGIGVVSQGYPYILQPLLLLRNVEHSLVGMMVSFTPMAIILISIPVLGVKPTRAQLVGVVGGLGFLALLFSDGLHRGHALWLMALMITVPISYGIANAYLKKSLSSVTPLPATTLMLFTGGIILVPLAMAGIAAPEHPTGWKAASIAMLLLGPTGTGLASWLWVRLVDLEGPLFAGMVTYVVPVVALFWGVFDGETITKTQLFAIAGVLTMVALVQFASAKKRSLPAEPVEAPAEDQQTELVTAACPAELPTPEPLTTD